MVGPWLWRCAPDDASREGEAAEVLQINDVGVVAMPALCIESPKKQDAIVRQQSGRVARPLQLCTCNSTHTHFKKRCILERFPLLSLLLNKSFRVSN